MFIYFICLLTVLYFIYIWIEVYFFRKEVTMLSQVNCINSYLAFKFIKQAKNKLLRCIGSLTIIYVTIIVLIVLGFRYCLA